MHIYKNKKGKDEVNERRYEGKQADGCGRGGNRQNWVRIEEETCSADSNLAKLEYYCGLKGFL